MPSHSNPQPAPHLHQTTTKKPISPVFLLCLIGVLMGVGVWVATRLPKEEKERSSWIPVVHEKLSRDEQQALAKVKGPSAADNMIRNYQRKIYMLPKKPELWVLLGQSWIRKARNESELTYYQQAEACVRIATHLSPEHPGALNLLGLIYIHQHEFAKAIKIARQILSKKHDDAMAWGTLSDAHLERGEYPEAADAIEKMSQIKPGLPAYIRAAYLMWIKGEVYQARKLVEHAYDAGRGQKDHEPIAWVLSEGAKMFWHIGNYKEADQGYDMAMLYVPDYPPALVGKAQIAMAQNNPKLAVTLLENSYRQRPLAHTAWILGDARMMLEDKAGAQKAYDIVEKIGSDDRRVLALFWATKNIKLNQALLLIREEYKIRADIYTEDVIAWLLYRLGRTQEALVRIQRATRHNTKDSLLLYHKGAILLANQQIQAGRQAIQTALQLNPHFDWTAAQEARILLQKTEHLVPRQPTPKPTSQPTSQPVATQKVSPR